MAPTDPPLQNPFQSPAAVASIEKNDVPAQRKAFLLFWAMAIVFAILLWVVFLVGGAETLLPWMAFGGLTFLHAYLKLLRYPGDHFPNAKKQLGELFISAAVSVGLFTWGLACFGLTFFLFSRTIQIVIPNSSIEMSTITIVAAVVGLSIYFVSYIYTIRPMFRPKPAKPDE